PAQYQNALKGKTLGMWFEKPSLRTRVSFEAGMGQLGGTSVYLSMDTLHGTKASLRDEIRCLSRYVHCLCARVYDHQTILDMATWTGSVPVINALSDKHHPCQALADLMTVWETFPDPKKSTMAFVGDGNNVCNSLVLVAKKLGVNTRVATPDAFRPMIQPDFWTDNPIEAVEGADVVYTDVWVSMGEEKQAQEKERVFKPYQVNESLLKTKYFMHCLPAIRGKEVTDAVIDGPKSLVFQQAENRLHAQKALLMKLVGA
ncbi:MAG TPA: ornithine carbamoyltransferase, partial [Candidatus Norongarragalinales archaeon]|nr:ornithine carbamoyltransferase [Candidatus Norongarragalinales archaeon]